MKTKFNNSELSHIWANQTQAHGKGSNMFFEHGTIYSYGYHFKITQFINNKEAQRCVFINSSSYSSSTAKHQSLVWRAIPQDIPFFKVVSFFNDIEASSTAHKENLTYYINEAEKLQGLTIRANKLKMGYLNQLNGQMDIFIKYTLFFGLTDLTKFNPITGLGLTLKERYEKITEWVKTYEDSDELLNWLIKQKENEKKAEIKAKERAKITIEQFRNFEISAIYQNIGHYILRYNKETENIETSGGVKMAKNIFLTAYQRLINNQLIKGQHVGDFTFNGVDGEIVSVGCHKIPLIEVKNVVSLLG
jgi:hypothetical protein